MSGIWYVPDILILHITILAPEDFKRDLLKDMKYWVRRQRG